ncbi:MAG: carbohydrate binding family 9 domain-containing protein [Acidobacteria bacterium]|nr:carbohydrate binding family 9 domain-containing protein [Acidobacteriota bacterium]
MLSLRFVTVLALLGGFVSVAMAQDLGSAPASPTRPSPTRLTAEQLRAIRARAWEAEAVRVEDGPKIDGALTEPEWQRAKPIVGFYQREPDEGMPSSERTEVRIIYTDRAIYLGFTCFDREPEKVRASAVVRDGNIRTDDYVSVILDPFHDRRTGFNFSGNINGMRIDAIILGEDPRGSETGGTSRNRDWNGVFRVKGSKTPKGYELEMEIPFKTLRFPERPMQTWGVILKRVIPRRVEESFWPFIPRDRNPYGLALGGNLNGLRELKPGRSIELLPYVTSGVAVDIPAATSDGLHDAGVDLKWGVTSNLTADFTYNTDFAQAEIDSAQINLTRFPLFFPEKRQFFLEGARLFDFGLSRTAQVFFSRRIGLTSDGREVPLLGGARLSGKSGKYGIGLLNMQARDLRSTPGAGTPAANFTVARFSRDIWSRSRIGTIVTNKTVTNGPAHTNQAFGVDGDFVLLNNLFINAFAARTATTGVRDRQWGTYGLVNWYTDRFGAQVSRLDLQDNFNPEVGFVPRRGIRDNGTELRWSPRPPRGSGVRQFHFIGQLNYLTDQHNRLQTRTGGIVLGSDMRTGDTYRLVLQRVFDSFDRPFTLRRDAIVPAGAYHFQFAELRYNSFYGRNPNVDMRAAFGEFLNGTRRMVGGSFNWQSTHWAFIVDAERNFIDLPTISYTSNAVNTTSMFNLSPDFAVRMLNRWSSDSRRLSTNVRLNWIYRPGSDLYIVYNEVDEGPLAGLVPRNRQFIVKMNYLMSF